MNRFDRSMQRKGWLRNAEASGQVADSLEVRVALIKRMDAGELTLAQVQEELKRIKRNAKRNGQVTRAKAYLGHLPDKTSPDPHDMPHVQGEAHE